MLRAIVPHQPIYKGSHFHWLEVWEKSGYPLWQLPIGPYRMGNGRWVLTPRRNAIAHARKLDVLRERINAARHKHGLPETGIHINSWARSYEHNRAVGGASNSEHLYLLATDITREEVHRLCPWDAGSSFDVIASDVFARGGFGTYPGGARHVDTRGYRARWSSWVPSR